MSAANLVFTEPGCGAFAKTIKARPSNESSRATCPSTLRLPLGYHRARRLGAIPAM